MSDLIRSSREQLGLTGAQLAERLGVTVGAVSQLERSERAGSIKIESLERALSALGRRLTIGTTERSPYAAFTPAAVTDEVNTALDRGDGSYALRLITHAADVVKKAGDRFSDEDLQDRPSEIKDRRWEQLFRAVYGAAIAPARRPSWTTAMRLPRRWYVSRFAPLRERAKTSTPPRLRELNIYIDERSLATR